VQCLGDSFLPVVMGRRGIETWSPQMSVTAQSCISTHKIWLEQTKCQSTAQIVAVARHIMFVTTVIRHSLTKLTARGISEHVLGKSRTMQCPHCDQRFTSTGELTSHLRTLIGERPYHLTAKRDLIETLTSQGISLRTLAEEKLYQCPNCNERFTASGELTVHIRTHTGEKLYQCPHCEKRLARSFHLTPH